MILSRLLIIIPKDGGGDFLQRPVLSAAEALALEYDTILISTGSYEEIVEQLTKELHIPPERIQLAPFLDSIRARVSALKNIAFELNRKKAAGAAAELGVYRGDFARHINTLFPDRALYLFDTFQGFDERDIQKEKELFHNEYSNDAKFCDNLRNISSNDHLSNTNVQLVLSKMRHPENCRVFEGYFPESAKAVPAEERFCFVNIDVDMYQPALAGLRYFYKRMTPGGILLLHDYYDSQYVGVIRAFDEFYDEYNGVKYVPLGDNGSIAIIK